MMYFRRKAWNNPSRYNTDPRWHIGVNGSDRVALCGYTLSVLEEPYRRQSVKDNRKVCGTCRKRAAEE